MHQGDAAPSAAHEVMFLAKPVKRANMRARSAAAPGWLVVASARSLVNQPLNGPVCRRGERAVGRSGGRGE